MIYVPIRFNQQDTRWGSIPLGNNAPNSKFNLHDYGCLITVLAMIGNYYGRSFDPSTINDLLKQNGGFTSQGGDYVWGGFTKLMSDVKEYMVETPGALTDNQLGQIKSALDGGFPVMLMLDYNPQSVALNTHYVLAVAYNPLDEDDITIIDPIGGIEKSLKAYLGWYFPSARKTIHQYAIYMGPRPTVRDEESITIKKSVNELNVKKATQWNDFVWAMGLGEPDTVMFNPHAKTWVDDIKSNVISLQRDKKLLQEDLAIVSSEVKNRTEENEKIKKLFEMDRIAYLKRIDELTKEKPQLRELEGLSEERFLKLYDEWQKEIEEKYNVNNKLALLEKQLELVLNGGQPLPQRTNTGTSWLTSLLHFLRLLNTDYGHIK